MSESHGAQDIAHERQMHAQGPVRTYVTPDIFTKKHHERPRTAKHRACASELRACKRPRQSQQRVWLHSLPFQRFQALLTLFPKSFSSFPHGTCSLSAMRYSRLIPLLTVLLASYGEISQADITDFQEDCAGAGNLTCAARLFCLRAFRRDASRLRCGGSM